MSNVVKRLWSHVGQFSRVGAWRGVGGVNVRTSLNWASNVFNVKRGQTFVVQCWAFEQGTGVRGHSSNVTWSRLPAKMCIVSTCGRPPLCSCDGWLRSVLLSAHLTGGYFGARSGASLRGHIAETHPPSLKYCPCCLRDWIRSELGGCFEIVHPPTSRTSRRSPARHCGVVAD